MTNPDSRRSEHTVEAVSVSKPPANTGLAADAVELTEAESARVREIYERRGMAAPGRVPCDCPVGSHGSMGDRDRCVALRRVTGERDFYIRLFNRLEQAVSRHKAEVEYGTMMTLPGDRGLYAAHERIRRDAAKGPDWRPERKTDYVRPGDQNG